MKWLLYGSRGWIGEQLKNTLLQMNEKIIEGTSRCDNYSDVFDEIMKTLPDRVISTIGRTHGGQCASNIDYLESKDMLSINIRDNMISPIILATICQTLNIHFTYLGTGCIYEYDETHTYTNNYFTEDDKPNFKGSQYSIIKGQTDQIIRNFSTTLNARIRMPISCGDHPRNFITKIKSYKKIISIPNSMSVLPDMIPILLDLAKNKHTGTINLCNPNNITHEEILELYNEYVEPITWNVMTLDELKKYTIGGRSNNTMSADKLLSLYPNVPNIKTSLVNIFKKWHK